MMLIDPHTHSSGISTCCRISGEQAVDAAMDTGLDGFVLTNHYVEYYVGGERFPTHEAFAQTYVEEFRRIKEYGDRKGFRVWFGLEVTAAWHNSVHLLVYGVEEDFILQHPRICQYPLEKLYETVHSAGGILVQAHPYRLERLLQDLRYLDGVEASCHPHLRYGGSYSSEMEAIARENGKILTCGGDFHGDVPYRPNCGILLPETVKSVKEMKEFLCSSPEWTLRIHEPGGEVFDLNYHRKGDVI